MCQLCIQHHNLSGDAIRNQFMENSSGKIPSQRWYKSEKIAKAIKLVHSSQLNHFNITSSYHSNQYLKNASFQCK